MTPVRTWIFSFYQLGYNERHEWRFASIAVIVSFTSSLRNKSVYPSSEFGFDRIAIIGSDSRFTFLANKIATKDRSKTPKIFPCVSADSVVLPAQRLIAIPENVAARTNIGMTISPMPTNVAFLPVI